MKVRAGRPRSQDAPATAGVVRAPSLEQPLARSTGRRYARPHRGRLRHALRRRGGARPTAARENGHTHGAVQGEGVRREVREGPAGGGRGAEPCASSTPPVRSGPASTTASRHLSASISTRCCAWSRRRSTSCCTPPGRPARPPPSSRSATCSTGRATAACTPPSRPRVRPAKTWRRRCVRCLASWVRTRDRPWAMTSWTTPGPASSRSSARTGRCARR